MVNSNKKDTPKEMSVTISFRSLLRLTLLIIATILLFGALVRASHAILLLFSAFFLALALNSPVYWLAKNLPGKGRGSRSAATTLSFIFVVVALSAFLATVGPPLIKQTQTFVKAAPSLVQDFRSQNSATGTFIRENQLDDDIDKISSQLAGKLSNSSDTAYSTVQKTTSSFFSVLTVIVLTFMMLVEGPRWMRFFKEVTPKKHREQYEHLTNDMYGVIKGFVNGQLLLAIIASIVIVPMLFILDISYPIALMVVVFICGLIPMVGATIGAVIVTTVALFTSINAALIILAYYILYQQFENYIIQPRIQANTTNMSPLMVFSALVIGVSFGGLIGGLLAIPVAGCLRILFLEYLRSQKIIDSAKYKKLTTETK